MPRLSVSNFSCIREAFFELRPLSVLVGPQASGKSLLSKLFYFLSNVIAQQYDSAQDQENIKFFKKRIGKQFSDWFPPIAWGNKPFEITYEAGALECRIIRRRQARRLSEDVEVEFSEFFENQFEQLVSRYRSYVKKRQDQDEFSPNLADESWRVRSASHRELQQLLGSEYIGYQLFVPAGRSFFTTLGKAIAMFEYGSQLDEITRRFGRLFTSLLDGNRYYYSSSMSSSTKEFLLYQKEAFEDIFDGEIKMSRNDRHVLTRDGRRIPFSILSSGQQELLPLLLITRHYARVLSEGGDPSTNLLYIEEPEAHLFPASQGALTEHLAAVSNFTSPSGSMFITTHSPYVLSRLNTLIKASTVGANGSSNADKVGRIVPRRCWLAPDRVTAYAIEGGVLRLIQDESGLLDGEYLDSISNEITSDFMGLLEIEAKSARRRKLP